MGISVAQAALSIRRVVDGNMSSLLHKQISLRGFDARYFSLLAYGGAGPVHACDVGRDLGMATIMVFPFSAEFCAFGAACADILHQYQSAQRIELYSSSEQRYLDCADDLNEVLEALDGAAKRDFAAEGLDVTRIEFDYEYSMRFGPQLGDFRLRAPIKRASSRNDIQMICQVFVQQYNEYFGAAAAYLEAGIEIKAITLWARLPRPRPQLLKASGRSYAPNPTASRRVLFSVASGYVETAIHDEGALRSGAVIEGPAVIERSDTSIVIPPDARFIKDPLGNGLITWK
jgi:N-methylhydantoinase A/oxoprolinase/acetone carboxylase beta subunit